jgi:hypothetical protein
MTLNSFISVNEYKMMEYQHKSIKEEHNEHSHRTLHDD